MCKEIGIKIRGRMLDRVNEQVFNMFMTRSERQTHVMEYKT